MLDEFSRSKLLKKFGVCSQKNKKNKKFSVCYSSSEKYGLWIMTYTFQ
jgi:hypothetical protein